MNARTRMFLVDADREATARIAARADSARYHVQIAESAEEALELASFEPAILISELHLPGASGLDLLSALHDRGLAPHAIFTAALPTFHDCRRAFKLGAAELLAKPIDLDALFDAVDALEQPTPSSNAPATTLELQTEATAAGVETAVRESLAFAMRMGVAPAARARLAGAVAELADNVRLHAYDQTHTPSGVLSLQARFDGSEIEIHLTDEGCGFDTVGARLDAAPAALPWSDSEPGGLARAAALAEGLSLSSSRLGTRVTLRISTGRATFADDDANDLSELDYLAPRKAKQVLRAVHAGRSGDLLNIPPALAVVLGRLLAGPTSAQLAQTSLWS